jgi:hypothetical protein
MAQSRLLVILTACALVTIASAAAEDPPHSCDPLPPGTYSQFVAQVVAGACPDYHDAVAAGLDVREEPTEAFEACWREYVAPRRITSAEAREMERTFPVEPPPDPPRTDNLPRFSTDSIPPEIYRRFRDTVILAGKCQAYEDAQAPVIAQARKWKPCDPPITYPPEMLTEMNDALDACFRDFIAPHL